VPDTAPAPDHPFAGGTAVVTGGGSGFGRALAHRFADAGMHVVVADIDVDHARLVAAELPDASAVRVDVGDPASVHALAGEVGDQAGELRVLAANVGVQQINALDDLSADDWRWVIEVNVLGTVGTVEAFLPLLRAASGMRRILLTTSTSATYAAARLGAYTASKYAVLGYGETLRLELAAEGIGVTMVMPSAMATTHVESSAAARPVALGPSGTTDEDLMAVGAAMVRGPDDVATPEHAARHVIDALVEDRPFLVTHGSAPAAVEERFRAIVEAFTQAND
jgi:NAD(P)-dependent dehydrogenase (short-subunit alcohol dehydrogenase family)